MEKFILAITFAAFGPLAAAGTPSWTPAAVPVDSPFVLAGLALVIALAGARVLRNRSK